MSGLFGIDVAVDVFLPEVRILEIVNNDKLSTEQKIKELAELGVKATVIVSLLGVSSDLINRVLEE